MVGSADMRESPSTGRKDLAAVLHSREVELLFSNARLIHEYPDSAERERQAERQVRMVMYRAAVGEITKAERDAVITVLAPCCPGIFPLPDQPGEEHRPSPRSEE